MPEARTSERMAERWSHAALVVILLSAAALRLFWWQENEAIWPDEAVYLLMARSFAGLSEYDVPAARSVLLPLLWSCFFRLGFGELAVRASVSVFSLLGIALMFQLGREIYGRAVGLIASALLAVFSLHLFFSARVLTDVPALTLWLAVLLLFWRSCASGEDRRAILCLGPTFAVLVLTRYAYALLLPVLLAMIFIARGPTCLRDRSLWMSGALGGLTLTPWLVWCTVAYGHPLAALLQRQAAVSTFYAASVAESYPSGLLAYLAWFPDRYLDPVLCAVLGVGLVLMFIDRFGSDEPRGRLRDVLMIAWVSGSLVLVSYGIGHNEPRFLLPVFPALFALCAQTSIRLGALSKPLLRTAVALPALLLLWPAWLQLNRAATGIEEMRTSYLQVRRIAEWLRDNAPADALVLTSEREVNLYYSGIASHWYPEHQSEFNRVMASDPPPYVVLFQHDSTTPAYLRELEREAGLEFVTGLMSEDEFIAGIYQRSQNE